MSEDIRVRYGYEKLRIKLPENMKVIQNVAPKDLPEMSSEEIMKAISNPIGTGKISEIAEGKESVALVVDDHTRPTPASRMIPFILKELENAGIRDDQIEVIMAVAGHRMMTDDELRRKLGDETLRRLKVTCHDPFRNMTYFGTSKAGVPIWINKRVAESDVKICVGGIIPHIAAGYGGGAKTILPGVCSIETIKQNHEYQDYSCVTNVESAMRKDIEDVAERIGLDFIVNAVLNCDAKICGVFAGHFVKAHREGVKLAEQVYKVNIPKKGDVVLASSFPQDIDVHYSLNTMTPAAKVTKEGGTLIMIDPLYDGFGYHAIHLPFLEMNLNCSDEISKKMNLVMYSTGISEDDFYRFYPRRMKLTNSLHSTIDSIASDHKEREVIIMQAGPLTVPTFNGREGQGTLQM